QACGVCHSEALTVQGHMPGLKYPRVPGHEVIGTVEAVGPDIDGWQTGTRVGVGWFPGNCGYCRQCRRGNLFACEYVQGATGVTRDGGYATHMLAHVSALARVPTQLDAVQSAPLLCAGITTFNALRHCGAGPGDLVAIHGIGGLGHLGIQFAARLGFRVVAVNRGRDKETLARTLGAHEYIDSSSADPAVALRELGGACAILTTVTDAGAMQAVLGGLGANGTMMVIGAAGAITVDSLDLLRKRAVQVLDHRREQHAAGIEPPVLGHFHLVDDPKAITAEESLRASGRERDHLTADAAVTALVQDGEERLDQGAGARDTLRLGE